MLNTKTEFSGFVATKIGDDEFWGMSTDCGWL
jgi:hypothetical protein